MVVVGRGSRKKKEGSRPAKLVTAERLVKQGHRLHIIGEAEFRRLVRAE